MKSRGYVRDGISFLLKSNVPLALPVTTQHSNIVPLIIEFLLLLAWQSTLIEKIKFFISSVSFVSLFPVLRAVTHSGGTRGRRWERVAAPAQPFLRGCCTLLIHQEQKGQDRILLLIFFWFPNRKPRDSACNKFIKRIKHFFIKTRYLETAKTIQVSRTYYSY